MNNPRNLRSDLLRVLALIALSAVAAGWSMAEPVPTQQILLEPPGACPRFLDDPQPDTIRYDDDTPAQLNTARHFWAAVKFTAPADFEMRSVYFMSINGASNEAPCSLFVYSPGADGYTPTDRLSAMQLPGVVPDARWNAVNLPSAIALTQGQDFLIIVGPNPGGRREDGWHVLMDNQNTNNRSRIADSANGLTGSSYVTVGGDYLIRVGGAISSFVDLRAQECFYEIDGPSLFNLRAGTLVSLRGLISAPGPATVSSYTVQWTVHGPSGATVHACEAWVGMLHHGETQTVHGDSFRVNLPGEYLVSMTVRADSDRVLENNTTYLRFFAGGNHRWYHYDDNLDAETYVGFSPGNGWGVSFAPSEYSARVDSVRINLMSAGTGDFRLYLNNGFGTPMGDPLWSVTPPIVSGWNTVAVNPPVEIYAGQSFTLAYMYRGVSLGKDITPPNDADITRLGTISWQSMADGQVWVADRSGNWCMQAYLDTSTARATYPVLECSRGSLDFGDVDVNAGSAVHISLRLYNRGADGALQLQDLMLTDSLNFPAFTFSPEAPFWIAAGDSADVDVTFDPSEARSYDDHLYVVNDSPTMPILDLPVHAAGVQNGANAERPRKTVPSSFVLGQNYPNPFNPSTTIDFSLPVRARAQLTVYNLLGQQVASLSEGVLDAGSYSRQFQAAALPSGFYFYRLDAGDFHDVRKMILMK
jgi:hypothetical protein